MFDPTVGTWLSEDPSDFEAGDPNRTRPADHAKFCSCPTAGGPLIASDQRASLLSWFALVNWP
jgi:hypothetical protein